MESSVAKSGREMDVGKMTDKFMMELAAPASKHSATGFASLMLLWWLLFLLMPLCEYPDSGALKKWTWLGHMDSKAQWQRFRASTPADVTWPRRKRTTKEPHLEERSWEGAVDSGIQVDGWRNIEAAAQNRAEDGKECSVTSCVHPLRATRLKSILACELSVD